MEIYPLKTAGRISLNEPDKECGAGPRYLDVFQIDQGMQGRAEKDFDQRHPCYIGA